MTLSLSDGLSSLRVGDYVAFNGEKVRIVALHVAPATEDDDLLGVRVGDPIATVELASAVGDVHLSFRKKSQRPIAAAWLDDT